jgi:DNA-binding NarL/FixJ family response regulator
MPPTRTDEGIRAARWIRTEHPGIGVFVLSQHIETAGAVGLVSEGGFGYFLKDRVLDVDEFLEAATRVARGGSALDPKVVASLVTGDAEDELAELTDREREVLSLLAQGLSNQEVAQRMGISLKTTRNHVSNILGRLQVSDRTEAVARARAAGLGTEKKGGLQKF